MRRFMSTARPYNQMTQLELLAALPLLINVRLDQIKREFRRHFSEGIYEEKPPTFKSREEAQAHMVKRKEREAKLEIFLQLVWKQLPSAAAEQYTSVADLDLRFASVRESIPQLISDVAGPFQVATEEIKPRKKAMLEVIVDLYHELAKLRFLAAQLAKKETNPSALDRVCQAFRARVTAILQTPVDLAVYERAKMGLQLIHDDLTAIEQDASFAGYQRDVQAASTQVAGFVSTWQTIILDAASKQTQVFDEQHRAMEVQELVLEVPIQNLQDHVLQKQSGLKKADIDRIIDQVSSDTPGASLDDILEREFPTLDGSLQQLQQAQSEHAQPIQSFATAVEAYFVQALSDVQMIDKSLRSYHGIPSSLPQQAARVQQIAQSIALATQTYAVADQALQAALHNKMDQEIPVILRAAPNLEPCLKLVEAVKQQPWQTQQQSLLAVCKSQTTLSVGKTPWELTAEAINRGLAEINAAVTAFQDSVAMPSSYVGSARLQRTLEASSAALLAELKSVTSQVATLEQSGVAFAQEGDGANSRVAFLMTALGKPDSLQKAVDDLKRQAEAMLGDLKSRHQEIAERVDALQRKERAQAAALSRLAKEISSYNQDRAQLKVKIQKRQQQRQQDTLDFNGYTDFSEMTRRELTQIQLGPEKGYNKARSKFDEANCLLVKAQVSCQAAECAFTKERRFQEARDLASRAQLATAEAKILYRQACWDVQGASKQLEATKLFQRLIGNVRSHQKQEEYQVLVKQLAVLEQQRLTLVQKVRDEDWIAAVQLADAYFQAAQVAQQTYTKAQELYSQRLQQEAQQAAALHVERQSPPVSPPPTPVVPVVPVVSPVPSRETVLAGARRNMSPPPSPADMAAPKPPAQPGFFKRHWKKILIGAVVGLVIVGLVVAGIFTFGAAPVVFCAIAGATGLTTAVATGLGITTAAVVVAGAGAGVAVAGCAVADRCRRPADDGSTPGRR